MGCAGSKDDGDKHKGLDFVLPKLVADPNDLKEIKTEDQQRAKFFELAVGALFSNPVAELEALDSDKLTETTFFFYWLAENHFYTKGELAAMSIDEQKAAAVAKGGLEAGEKTAYELAIELSNLGTSLAAKDAFELNLKDAAVYAYFMSRAEADAADDAAVKKNIQDNLVKFSKPPGEAPKEGEEAKPDAPNPYAETADEDLINGCYALGFIRGAAIAPEGKLKEMDLEKMRLAVFAAISGALSLGMGALAHKDKKAHEFVKMSIDAKKSLTLQPFVKAYKPMTEEEKKKKAEDKAKKEADAAAAAKDGEAKPADGKPAG
jgi:hypothetical protein